MALLFPQVGEVLALTCLVNKATPQNLVLKLFKSNTTPAATDIAGTYTEADFTGYSAATLTGSSWTSTAANPSHVDYAQQTFTSSAGSQSQNVYGYFMVQASSGTLMLAERFSNGPYLIQNNADAIQITPVITGT